eukprot:COSAG01_NODE_1244_length_11080_cov_16.595338_8_plen_175_part_00
MQDSAYGSSHGAFLQKPSDDAVPTPSARARRKTCKFSTDFGPRDVAAEINYDVDQLHDRLPQPYRLINQLLNELVIAATEQTFADDSDKSLATGCLDWRVHEGAAAGVVQGGRSAEAVVVRASSTAPFDLGGLVAWCPVAGTPFRIAADASGALIACAFALALALVLAVHCPYS